MSERIIRRPEVRKLTGYGNTSIYEMVKKGEFPRPISLGARAVGWLESEVDAWIQQRVSASRKDGGNNASA